MQRIGVRPRFTGPACAGSKHREPRMRHATDVTMDEELARKAAPHMRGRAFAIVSYADTGRTILTEELLLFGGRSNWQASGGGCARIGWQSSASTASRSPRR